MSAMTVLVVAVLEKKGSRAVSESLCGWSSAGGYLSGADHAAMNGCSIVAAPGVPKLAGLDKTTPPYRTPHPCTSVNSMY